MKRHYFYIVLFSILCVILPGCRSSQVSTKTERTSSKNYSSISKDRKRILEEARTWMGTPYLYAGAEKSKGTDCSGLVMKVYLDVLDMKLPRNSEKQAEFCTDVPPKDVEPGDLVFFATGKDPHRVSHVGIMLDSESFIHSSATKGVCISSVKSPYYIRRFIKYGRVPNAH